MKAKKEKVFVAMYNPMIHESTFGVISIHKTRKGAEMAIDFHKNEEREEYERVYKGIPESQRVAKFDAFKSWIVESFELTE